MRYRIFATDYDGTFAHHGVAAPETIQAVERLRASGRRTMMVTGREIEDLKKVFPRLDIFDLVVGENGAVLYEPATGRVRLLQEPPPPQFAEELRARGVTPLDIGRVVVATLEPHETIALEVIKKMGLELEIIFNKGSVMILPSGVNKAFGLAAALQEWGEDAGSVVGMGDAENDHAFLRHCGCGVAVSNALQSLKDDADYVTLAPHGEGVVELINLMLETDLEGISRTQAPVVGG